MAAVTSNTDQDVKERITRGDYSLVYFTPELLSESNYWRKLLSTQCYRKRVKAFIVDEAHCVKKW